MAFNLQVAASNVPPGTCYPPTWQQAIQSVASNLLITGLGALNSFNYGPTTPATDLQGLPWIKTDSQYALIGLYTFTNGSWQPAAPAILPGSVMDFFGLQSSIVAPYYVCNGQAITGPIGGALTTPNLSGLVTLGAGTNPTTGTNFAYGTAGGEEKHAQLVTEMAAHTHPPSSGNGFISYANSGGNLGTTSGTSQVDSMTGSTGGGVAFNVMQPYMALYKIIFWP